MKQIFTLLTVLITTMFVNAQTYTLTDDDVVVTNNVIESCSYGFAIKDIIIPENLDGQTVTGIGYYPGYPFKDKGITSIQLPSTLEIIGSMAFAGNSLTDVTIPNSVTTIGDYAFYANNLTNVIIPNTITSIGYRAFVSNSLTSVTFEAGSNILSIGTYVFADNTDLTSITLPTNANSGFVEYKDSNGTTYAEGDNITDFSLLYYVDIPYTLTDDDVVVTNGTIESCSYGFASKNIIIPETLDGQTVTGIKDGSSNLFAFNNITSVQLPSTLEIIGSMAFAGNSLTDVTIPNLVTSIGNYAFYSNNLTGIIIPNSVTSIGDRAFYDNNLTTITIPNSVTSIENSAFNTNQITEYNGAASNGIIYARNTDGSEDFTTIVSYGGVARIIDFIPNTVTSIGDYAFTDNSLTGVIIPNTVTSIGDWAFYKNNLIIITMPHSVTSIGNDAFSYNSLTSIIIPNSVISIGERAFYANNLTGVIFETSSNIIFTGKSAFAGNFGLISIPLPTHANSNFVEYKDENGISYNPGDNITDFYISYEAVITVATYTVTFNDWDGTELKTETVEHGSAATAPADPTRAGYTFTGWDITFDNVIAYLTVTAQYELNTSIEDITNTVLSIYPNPAHNYVFVESSGLKVKNIQIFDITGKLIKTVRPDAQNIRLDISDLTTGLHFIKVETGSTSKVLKFVKR